MMNGDGPLVALFQYRTLVAVVTNSPPEPFTITVSGLAVMEGDVIHVALTTGPNNKLRRDNDRRGRSDSRHNAHLTATAVG